LLVALAVPRSAGASGQDYLPDAPGFGVTFDADFIKTYRVN
jgi:hypothetical protein